MNTFYIDESGSMTVTYCDRWPYFIITLIKVKDNRKAKTIYKRFVSKNLSSLKEADTGGSMFNNEKFKELKGSAFTPSLKRKFADYFFRDDTFEVFYIVVNNDSISKTDNGRLYANTSRAFNYLIKLAITHYRTHDLISREKLLLQLDERNEKPESKNFLQDYLNTELYKYFDEECEVKYFDSQNNHLIQVADVMSNLMFSNKLAHSYEDIFNGLRKKGIIKDIFVFPPTWI